MSKRKRRKRQVRKEENGPPPDDEEEEPEEEMKSSEEEEEEEPRETQKNDDGEDYEDDDDDEVEKVLEKTVRALKVLKQKSDRQERELARLRKEDEPYPDKGQTDGPEFPDGSGVEDVDDNPEEEVAQDDPPEKYTDPATQEAGDTSSKPAADTTDEDETRIPKSHVEQIVQQALEKQEQRLEKKVPELVKASTPAPPGFSDNETVRGMLNKNKGDQVGLITDMVNKAIQEDREASGGSFSTQGRVGIRKGTEDTHYKVNQYLNKTFFGGW